MSRYTRQQRAEIERHVRKWRGLLMLNAYEVNIQFSDTDDADDKEHPDATTSADMFIITGYMSGHVLRVFPRMFDGTTSSWRERRVAHEMAHLLTDEMRALLRALLIEEQVVTIRQVRIAHERLTDWITSVVVAMDGK